MESGLILLPILIVTGGVIAYVGNAVGRATGRRRLSLFGLRPRHTAQLITVATGVLTTVVTVVAILLASSDARTGLFHLHELREQIRQAEARLEQIKQGDIAYLRAQEVLREVIDGRRPLEEIQARLDAMRLRAVDLAVAKGIAPDLVSGAVLILDPPNVTWEAIARLVASRRAETIVRLVAAENTLRGEALRVFVMRHDRVLAYRAGTRLGSGVIDARIGRERVGLELLALVDRVSEGAASRLLSPPFARITDPPSTQVDVDEHRRAVAEILRRGGEVRVDVVVRRDVTTEMPLVVGFALRP